MKVKVILEPSGIEATPFSYTLSLASAIFTEPLPMMLQVTVRLIVVNSA